ncbi:type I-F CRISPR-associated endoribonuclease Cas6/Csy4 [Thiorhodococcus fuscus]|uniref:Type I-F CRISPR-associated endoribonuclease Cas6/Csy4 n=1 Tax=Thiorhodococcus fuscus TaxID=527200 RepID=A0ABW4YAJ7_9GAMM
MLHYVDIRLLPDPEFPEHLLMGALFTKLHRLLVEVQACTIGVSFPGYRETPPTLGNTLRLLGPEPDLTRLMENPWLKGMRDHTEVKPIAPIPANAAHRPLRRIQVKSSPDRLRRRQMRRHGLTEQQALDRIPNDKGARVRIPFVTLSSTSTGQRFPLFLELGPPISATEKWSFNTYGLSNSTPVPWF